MKVPYVPKRVGRPTKRRGRGRPKKYKSPGPGSPLRRVQYKMLNLRILTHQMLKELSGYYETPMSVIVHRMIEAAFEKTLLKIEGEEKKGESDVKQVTPNP